MSSEYVTDTTYVRHFDPDLASSRFRLIAALNGFPQPPARNFDYCELGCAHGDTLVALAAANPDARFVGVDLNPAHIVSARETADAGGVTNVRFLARDFTELPAEELGLFDYVTAHGVLSWVGQETRAKMIALASRCLRPGGLLYVSYNAMPGWGAVEPLRQLLLSPPGGGGDGSSLDRAKRGLAFAQALDAAGAEYFVQNPSAREMLAAMAKAGLPYVVHEYLHANWAPMYFAQVAWEMKQSELNFLGVLPPYLNFRDMAVSAALQPLFEGVTDRVLYESLRDFATNEFLRRDLYVKGKAPRSAAATEKYFAETPFALVSSAAPKQREHAFPHRTLKLAGPLFDALFAELAEGAKTGAALADRPSLASFGAEKVRASLIRLLIAELAMPMSRETHATAIAMSAPLTVPSLYNRASLERLTSERPPLMASEAAGTGIMLTVLERLALRAIVETKPGKLGEWVRRLFEGGKVTLTVKDELVTTHADRQRVIADAVKTLREEKLSKLVELGIVEALPRK